MNNVLHVEAIHELLERAQTRREVAVFEPADRVSSQATPLAELFLSEPSGFSKALDVAAEPRHLARIPEQPRPSEQHRHQLDLDRIDDHLQSLPARSRGMLVMHLRGHSHGEIADTFEMTPAATRTAISRLRRRLMTKLLGDDTINFDPQASHQHIHGDSSATA